MTRLLASSVAILLLGWTAPPVSIAVDLESERTRECSEGRQSSCDAQLAMWRVACESDRQARACRQLADAYQSYFSGVGPDLRLARRYYEAACRAGDTSACELGKSWGERPNSHWSAAIGYGAPFKLGGSLTRWIGVTNLGRTLDDPVYLDVSVSAGAGGLKGGVGVSHLMGVNSLGLRATVARTSAHPLGAAADTTWLGGEAEWSLARLVTAQAGVLYPVSGGEAKGPVFSWSIAVGFFFPVHIPCVGCT